MWDLEKNNNNFLSSSCGVKITFDVKHNERNWFNLIE